jgi:hypothetical protein
MYHSMVKNTYYRPERNNTCVEKGKLAQKSKS